MLKSSLKTFIIQCYYALIFFNFVVGGEFQMSEGLSGLNGVKNPLGDEERLTNQISEMAKQLMEDSLQFEPAQLDFGSCALGTTRTITVSVINKNQKRGVRLSVISAKDPSFYSSSLEIKTLLPRSNTTFTVVFLPWREGLLESTIVVQTSFGQMRLPVKGFGKESPYRLKPIVGIKAPLNATLMPEIHLYNPHDRTLQILEVYSTGGQFQLELPSGGKEGPQNLWEIPAYSTRPIIRIRFHGQSAGNYTAYIRVKVAQQMNTSSLGGNSENAMIIPVSFEILPQYGIYLANPVIEFGRIISNNREASIQFNLQMKNSNPKRRYEFFEGSISPKDGFYINLEDKKLTIHPDTLRSTTKIDKLLTIRYLSKKEHTTIQKFSILVRGEIFKGSLSYDRNNTLLVLSDTEFKPKEPRKLSVRNDFDVPVSVMNISFQSTHKDYLDIQPLQDIEKSEGFTINPGETVVLLQIKVSDPLNNFKTNISIHTNVTRFEIPLFVCSGRLHVSTFNQPKFVVDETYSLDLDLGAIALSENSHFSYVVLRNQNFIPIKLQTWDITSPKSVYFNALLMGCFTAAENEQVSITSIKFKVCSSLEHGEIAVFQLTTVSYTTEPQSGLLKVTTPYELVTVEVKFTTMVGRIEVDQENIKFENCFPGRICLTDLIVSSSFKEPIYINSINFTEPGLKFIESSPRIEAILPKRYTKIGVISFDPAQLCKDDCYIPQDQFTKDIAFPKPRDTRGGENNNLHYDDNELRRRIESFRQYKWQFQNIHFHLHSEEIYQINLEMMVEVHWPRLIEKIPVFSPLEIGNSEMVTIELKNPTESGILVDYFLSNPRFAKETELSLPHEIVNTPSNCHLTDEEVYSLPGGATANPVLIPARESLKIPIMFQSNKSGLYCTLLHIRNNLTVYEAAWISAQSIKSRFRFGNRKPGSKLPLKFEITNEFLSICREKTKRFEEDDFPAISLRRTFTAKNAGDMPLQISRFFIGGFECEGYGFRVVDCHPFILPANATKRIDILFRPDFSFIKIAATLTMITNLTEDITFQLFGSVSGNDLPKCLRFIKRPPWEEKVRSVAICFMVLTFIMVVIAANIDYDNIIKKQSAQYFARDKGPMHPTFNLRNIAIQTRAANEEKNQKQKTKQANSNASNSNSKTNHNGSYLKKRDVRRLMANSNEPTFTERQFKLKREAEKALLEEQQAKQQHLQNENLKKHQQNQNQSQNPSEKGKSFEKDIQTSQTCDKQKDKDKEKEREPERESRDNTTPSSSSVSFYQTNNKTHNKKAQQTQQNHSNNHNHNIVPCPQQANHQAASASAPTPTPASSSSSSSSSHNLPNQRHSKKYKNSLNDKEKEKEKDKENSLSDTSLEKIIKPHPSEDTEKEDLKFPNKDKSQDSKSPKAFVQVPLSPKKSNEKPRNPKPLRKEKPKENDKNEKSPIDSICLSPIAQNLPQKQDSNKIAFEFPKAKDLEQSLSKEKAAKVETYQEFKKPEEIKIIPFKNFDLENEKVSEKKPEEIQINENLNNEKFEESEKNEKNPLEAFGGNDSFEKAQNYSNIEHIEPVENFQENEKFAQEEPTQYVEHIQKNEPSPKRDHFEQIPSSKESFEQKTQTFEAQLCFEEVKPKEQAPKPEPSEMFEKPPQQQKEAALTTLARNLKLAQESSSPTELMNCITSPWETNSQVAFNDVFQTDSMNKVLDEDKRVLYAGHLIGSGLQNNVIPSKPDLGPIGSRRSPTLTAASQNAIVRQAINGLMTQNEALGLPPNIPIYPSVVSQPNIGPSSPASSLEDNSMDNWHDVNQQQLIDIRRHQLMAQQGEIRRERHELLEGPSNPVNFLNKWSDLQNSSQPTVSAASWVKSSNSPTHMVNNTHSSNWLSSTNMRRPPPILPSSQMYQEPALNLQSLGRGLQQHQQQHPSLNLHQNNISLQQQYGLNQNLQNQVAVAEHFQQQSPTLQQQQPQQQQQQNFIQPNNQANNDAYNFDPFNSFNPILSNPWKQN